MAEKTKITKKTEKVAEEKMAKPRFIPRATEKAYTEQTKNTYIFLVPREASKQLVAEEVAKTFKVTVEDVRVLNRKGKATRFSRGRHAYPGITYRQDKKYAYVTLKAGDKIPVFEDTNERAEAESRSASRARAVASGAKRQGKPEEAKKEAKKSAKADDKKSEKKGDKK